MRRGPCAGPVPYFATPDEEAGLPQHATRCRMVGVAILPVRREHHRRPQLAERLDDRVAMARIGPERAVRQVERHPRTQPEQFGRGRALGRSAFRIAVRRELAFGQVDDGRREPGVRGEQQRARTEELDVVGMRRERHDVDAP